MSQIFPKLTLLLNPIILAIVLAYSYSWAKRLAPTVLQRNVVMGAVMGIAATMAMLNPFVVADGVIVDLRNLVVGLAGGFFGPIGLVIAMIPAVLMRMSIGGAGVMLGTAGIILSGSMGLLWAYTLKPRITKRFTSYAILGSMISSHLVLGILLPSPLAFSFMATVAPVLFIFNIIGAFGIGWLIAYEEQQIENESALKSAANTDPLTKLLNRRAVVEAFDALPTPLREDAGVTMLCFDIDHFKGINDTNGHLVGDAVLQEITKRVGACLRPSDLFSRIGGDEFLVVLPDVTRHETTVIAERCRNAISSKLITASHTDVDVSISVGAVWSVDERDFTTLLAIADESLYNAKSLGRDCVAFNFYNASLQNLPTYDHVHAARA